MGKFSIGVDLGGTKIQFALSDEHFNILKEVKVKTPPVKDEIIEAVTQGVGDVLRGVSPEDVRGIGFSCAGPVDPREGVMLQGVNLGWDNAPIKAIFEENFKLPVFVENDANCGALAEHRLGAGKGCLHMVYVTVSTGIGGGLILNGELYHGAAFGAGEIGHIVVDLDGPPCNCGGFGCVEALASGPATAKRAAELLRQGENSILREQTSVISAERVYAAAGQGDPMALRVVEDTGRYLGAALASLANTLNPEVFVIGGGVANAGELLLKPVRENLKPRLMKYQRESIKVLSASYKERSSIYGALMLPFL